MKKLGWPFIFWWSALLSCHAIVFLTKSNEKAFGFSLFAIVFAFMVTLSILLASIALGPILAKLFKTKKHKCLHCNISPYLSGLQFTIIFLVIVSMMGRIKGWGTDYVQTTIIGLYLGLFINIQERIVGKLFSHKTNRSKPCEISG